uniref:Cingulin-like 1 n=1 Tax=Oryzias sinensis TaxID=183150 RepID=A0A8C8E1S3_9TELE
MESYRVPGIPNTGQQRGFAQPSRPSRPHSNEAGTYGLSIRVQGIDGHPYVVLNNQDRGPQSLDSYSNGYTDNEGSFIENYQDYDFRGNKEASSSSPFTEYRTQKMMHHPSTQNGVSESQEKKPSTLLNFQRHPEILQPYDPETNSLNLEGFSSIPSLPPVQPENQFKSSPSKTALPIRGRSSSFDRKKDLEGKTKNPSLNLNLNKTPFPTPKSQPLPPAQLAEPMTKPQSQVPQPQYKPFLTNINSLHSKPTSKSQPVLTSQPPVGSSPLSEQSKNSCRSPISVSSANSSLERSRREPDVLPLRRIDSSGPVLESSPRSHHSSSPSTPKTPVEDQMEVLYADTINRHENRRYIPFHPGSGRDIDTGSIPAVDELIEKFDGSSHQRRGRAGRRNRINPEDRKRSRSVDSALGLRNTSNPTDEFYHYQGTSMEHVLRPSQLRLQKLASGDDGKGDPRFNVRSEPSSPQSTIPKGLGFIQGYKRPQSHSSLLPLKSKEREAEASSAPKTSASPSSSLLRPPSNEKPGVGTDVQATPDLLKGQQELSQQTHEETAKQILFNYLKEGSNDNDEVTKKKVNLVFEKIQTLKTRATASTQGNTKSADFAAQTKALQEQNAELEKEITELKRQLEKKIVVTTQKEAELSLKELQQELQRCMEECVQLKEKLAKTEADLRTTLEELFQVKMEREQNQTEIRDLQEQLSEMHDELDSAKRSAAADGEKDAIMADMMQLKLAMQEVLLAKEDQEELLRKRERELTALKGALKEEVSAHDQEVDNMKEQYETEISRLQKSLEEARQVSSALLREKTEVEAARGAAEGQTERLNQETEQLHQRAHELENEVAKLNRIIDEAKLQEGQLRDKAGRLEKEKKQMEESLNEIKEQEEEMSRANRALTLRLEDVQRNLSKLNSEHKELEERLQEERSQKEQFKSMKNNIEDERRLLDRTVEKLQREMSDIVEASQSSTRELQEQIDIYKEKNRRELTDLQRLLRERDEELDKCKQATKALEAELSLRDEDLKQSEKEQEEALLRQKMLEEKCHDLEVQIEKNNQAKDEKARQIKLMEVHNADLQIAQMEDDLEEERQSGDQLMNRIDRGREQVEQMRSELLQERASRQDLECDKMALERQWTGFNVWTCLHFRERANLQLANRKLERKVKEMIMQLDEEHLTMQDQKDQLNLRLKALKRQMDEAEEEIDRLEHGKKKLQRDLDEQQEANEHLQSQLKALQNEMRRKTSAAPLLNSLDEDDDDDVSTDGETYFSSSSSYKRSKPKSMQATFTI